MTLCYQDFNLLKGRRQIVTLGHAGLAYILICDIRALWRSVLSARVPECHKLKCRLDLDGTERNVTIYNATVL